MQLKLTPVGNKKAATPKYDKNLEIELDHKYDISYHSFSSAKEIFGDEIPNQIDKFIIINKDMGYIRYGLDEDSVNVYFIYVRPEFRGKGLASKMLDFLNEINTIELMPANNKLEEFYYSLGFRLIDEDDIAMMRRKRT